MAEFLAALSNNVENAHSPSIILDRPQVRVEDCTRPAAVMYATRSARTPSPPRRRHHFFPTAREPDSLRLITAIQLGHTQCLRNFLEDVCTLRVPPSGGQQTVSPNRTFNCIVDKREVPKGDYDLVTVKRHLTYTNSDDPHAQAVSSFSQVYEFEQTSNPLIWAVDCHEWACLRLMCSLQTSDLRGNEGPLGVSGGTALYNPSQPQMVTRRVTNNRGERGQTGGNGFTFGTNSACCPVAAQRRHANQACLNYCEAPLTLESRLKPFAAVMLSVSFSSLRPGKAGHYRSKSAQCSPKRTLSPPRKSATPSATPTGRYDLMRQASPTSPQRRDSCRSRDEHRNNDVVLIGSRRDMRSSGASSGSRLKRPTPYRHYWIRGSYTYQSLLDYFMAVGYEVVGTNWSCKPSPDVVSAPFSNIQGQCEHCRQDYDYPDCPNYPVGPQDPRNNIFLRHFSQLGVMLDSSGVSVNRLDAVLAFNALSFSAGRRLAGWCCHGAEGDLTIHSSLEAVTSPVFEPLIEWRILATLIDNGLNEFEWLEFLSPQHNPIGQALCVLAWPIYGWSQQEAANAYALGAQRRYSHTRRSRRRSSSPMVVCYPLVEFGMALKQQACLLLINLWALGAFTAHHITRNSGTRLWDRSGRSRSYTATMDGGDLRRIMLKTVALLPGSGNMEPLGLLRRWSYFQGLWRSALSGTPLPEAPPEIGVCIRHATSSSPQLQRRMEEEEEEGGEGEKGKGEEGNEVEEAEKEEEEHKRNPREQKCPPSAPVFPASSLHLKHPSFSDNRSYQPVCLRLQARRAIRRYFLNAQNARHGQNAGRGFQAQLENTGLSPLLRNFLGYFHKFEQLLSVELPQGLQAIVAAVKAEDPANFQLPS
ncbi:hypothetical protein SprV_0802466300 [Sparganum proliferum]